MTGNGLAEILNQAIRELITERKKWVQAKRESRQVFDAMLNLMEKSQAKVFYVTTKGQIP